MSDGEGLSPEEQREAVRNRYGAIAAGGESEATSVADATDTDADATDADATTDVATDAASTGCCPPATDDGDDTDSGGSEACCGPADESDGTGAEQLGYTAEDVAAVAEGADLGLGCGNPTAIASLEPGEDVLDLGSGGGFDCFLAAREVGPTGSVVGVDMTPEMVTRARRNAEKNDVDTVAFRLGEIEHLPVADDSIDVVISNCVINLSPDKPRVFDEAYRVLRPGGRLAVSDVVSTVPLPPAVRDDPESVSACVAGAATVDDLETMLADAGFEAISIEPKDESREFIDEWSDDRDLGDYICSAVIEARKPA